MGSGASQSVHIPQDKLFVRLERGKGLPSEDWGSKSDPSVTVTVLNLSDELPKALRANATHQFATKNNSSDPIWFEMAFLCWPREALQGPLRLQLSMVDKDTIGSDDVLLKTEIEVKQQPEGGEWVSHTLAVPGGGKLELSTCTEAAETMIVSKEAFESAPLRTAKVFELQHGDLSGGGKAVLVSATKEGNTRAILWLPGLDASFHHTWVIEPLLVAGFDVFSLDCRRMGRAKEYAPEGWDPLLAHDCANFTDYCEEIDLSMEIMATEKKYSSTILYANSTGAITALTYLRSGKGKRASDVSGLALNGPFLDWNYGAATELALEVPVLTALYAKVVVGGEGDKLVEGGAMNAYTAMLQSQYYFPAGGKGLRAAKLLHTTAAWAKAVTEAQQLYARANCAPIMIPVFVMSSLNDTYLSPDEIDKLSDYIGPMRTEVQIDGARHDVLASAACSLSIWYSGVGDERSE